MKGKYRYSVPVLGYYCFIFLIMINYGLENTNLGNPFRYIILILALTFASVSVITGKYRLKELLLLGICSMIGILIYLKSGYSDFLVLMLALFLINKIDLNKLLQLIFIERLFIFLIVNTLALTGISNITYVDGKGYGLGYGHPNLLSMQVCYLMFLYLALNRKRITKIKILLIFIIMTINYLITGTRASLILTILVILSIIFINKEKREKIFIKIIPLVYPSIFILNFGLIILYANFQQSFSLLHIINDSLLNGRIGLAVMNLAYYPITMFGAKYDSAIVAMYNRYYILDNGYTICLMYYGISGLLIYSYVWIKTMNFFKEEKETILAIIGICYIIWSIFEGNAISIGGNFIFLYYGKNLRKKISAEAVIPF